MNITKARLIEIIKEEVIKEAGGVAGNFGGVATELGAQRADGNDLPDHDLYGPQQTAEDNFVGILNEIGHMLDAWEKKKYPSDEARYMSYFEDLQGLLEQYDPCAHVGQKCEDVHPNQSHEECVEVTINNALYEAAQKLDEIPTWRKEQYRHHGIPHPGLSPKPKPLVVKGGRHDKKPGYKYYDPPGVWVRDDYDPRTDHGGELDKAIKKLKLQEQEGDGWPTVPPGQPAGSHGVCKEYSRSGTKTYDKLKDPDGYEKCMEKKKG